MQDELTRYARSYSEEMQKTGHFTHSSPVSGGLERRLQAVKNRYTSLSENLAKATSPEEVHRGLMASPGHRANILNPDHDVVGIGVFIDPAGGEQSIIVTQIFGTKRRPINVVNARHQFLKQLNHYRERLHIPSLQENALLNEKAEQATNMCFGRNKETPVLRKTADFRKMTLISFVASDPVRAISEIKSLSETKATFIGIGMRRGEEDPHQGSVCVVVVLGSV